MDTIKDRILKNIYRYKLDEYYDRVRLRRNKIKEIKELYKYIKVLERRLYDKGLTLKSYIRETLSVSESFLGNDYLLPYNPKFDLSLKYKDINLNDSNSVLDYIVNETRKYLYITYNNYHDNNTSIEKIPTINECRRLSNIAYHICKELGIKAKLYKISAGYTEKENIYDGHGFHYVVLLKLFNKNYLVDCSYAQFFNISYNNIERLGICNTQNVLAGRFMVMNEERRKIAEKILRDGWIELNEVVIKHYLDGFTLSFRNGLYYEKTNDFSYTTNYNIDDYIRFIQGKDNQINHEGKEVLGFQRVPLNNPYLKF